MSGPYRVDVQPASDAEDGVVDGATDGVPVTVAYWVDAPVAGLRVLDTNGLSSDVPAALVANLRSAGVPEADAGGLFGGPPAERVYQAGTALLVAAFLVVVIGPRPRRGTRWFWFWMIGGAARGGRAGLRRRRAAPPEVRAAGHRAPTGGRRPVERVRRLPRGRWRWRSGPGGRSCPSPTISPIWFIRG